MRSSKRQSRMMTRRTPGLVEVEAAWRIPLASARGHIRRRRYCGEIQDWMRAHRHAGHIRKLVITAHHGITLTTLTLATAPARTISSLRRWWRREAATSLAAASGGMHGYLQGRDAIEQASVSKRQSRLRLRLRRPGAYRWPGTPHGLKAEPQGAGSANVYSLRRS